MSNHKETYPSLFEKKHFGDLNDSVDDIIILNGSKVRYATSYGIGIHKKLSEKPEFKNGKSSLPKTDLRVTLSQHSWNFDSLKSKNQRPKNCPVDRGYIISNDCAGLKKEAEVIRAVSRHRSRIETDPEYLRL